MRFFAPAVLAALALAGCPKDESKGSGGVAPSPGTGTATGAGTGSGMLVTSAAPDANTPPPPPCTTDSPFTIDKGARMDTGLTVTEFANGKLIAVAYATGGGTPKVAMIDEDGKVTHADVAWSHVRDQETLKEGFTRFVHRVTALGYKNDKLRVGMDFLDKNKAGDASYLRCGPADVEPVISDEGGAQFDDPKEDQVAQLPTTEGDAAVDYRDCRTFGNATQAFVLATQVRRQAGGDNHNLAYNWVIDELPGKGMIKDYVIDSRVVQPKDGKYPKVEHFVTPTAMTLGDVGVLISARDGGNLVFAKRGPKLERAAKPVTMWLGAAAGLPAMNLENGNAYIAVTEWNKTDLFASMFAATDAPAKPAKVELTDANPREGSRDSASIDVTSDGNLAVAFVDGKPGKRSARMTVLGPDLKQKLMTVVDVSPADVSVLETRVVALLAKGRFLVTYLEQSGTLTGVPVKCSY